ncbi:hypothetical protein Slin15195_G059120 [Septoria linicola]|uniref:Uncharacterized protein n=1 Tax=Septoria linicola TaxID=215465 RepID=A0A9Q9EKP2_9PEZI|nr:hypothetical protein Slin14017_G074980 [Septoria linicola]USW52593.1 hypothetical protein Slin15195_G059120 [Septoria linicola]
MDSSTTNTTPTNDDGDDSAGATAQLEWGMEDAAGLAPSNVQIAKVQRAWERKPASPFSRRRFKVGKIMKRTGVGSVSAIAPAGMFNVHIREPHAAVTATTNGGTPVKAVKKMRVGSDAMDRAISIVRNWDGRGSPENRRIVTRSSLGQEGLVALAEGEDDQEAGLDDLDVTGLLAEPEHHIEPEEDPKGTTIEIFDETGTRVQDCMEGAVDDDDDWADEVESMSEVEAMPPATVDSAESMLYPPFIPTDRPTPDEDFDDNATEVDDPEEAAAGWQRLRDELHEERRKEAKSLGIPFDEYLRRYSPKSLPSTLDSRNAQGGRPPGIHNYSAPATATERLSQAITSNTSALPMGFVSPVATRRRSINQVKAQNSSRRRTLPKDFAARYTAARASGTLTAQHESEEQYDSSDDERVTLTPEQVYIMRQRKTTFGLPDESIEMPELSEVAESGAAADSAVDKFRPMKYSSSVPSVSGPDSRLPSRRSPRRQSSSPFKRKSILKSTEKPHLVAFTPIKRSYLHAVHPPSSPLPFVPSGISIEDRDLDQPARSSSAPPEEPQITPRKQFQPRISDDTALLEAFLKRASENKNGKRLSDTARRESFERRSESSVVPQALAGSPLTLSAAPAKDVLGDLDPNSPSPHKASASASAIFHDEGPKLELDYIKDPIVDDLDEDELAAEASRPQRFSASRKSGRMKKKPETLAATAYSGPQRIAIKASSEGVVLKQTEAQKLANETKKNTKSNKTGAVSPLIRLKALRDEQETRAKRSPELGSDDMEVERPPGRRGIRWAETLTSFYEGEEPEVSMTVEEPSLDPLSTQDDTMTGLETGSGVSATPAIETPSKPKLRRMKPPRTASTPLKPTMPSEQSVRKGEPEPELETDSKTKPKSKMVPKRKVSRIATPAKPKRVAVSDGEDMDDTMMADDETLQLSKPSIAPAPGKKSVSTAGQNSIPTPAPKRSTMSKLPAPAQAVPSVGKENSITASPPKKRLTKTSAHAAAPLRLGYGTEVKGMPPAPRFDIQKAAKSRPNDEGAMAGLISSPPKKATRVLPGKEVARGIVLGVGIGIDDEDIHHGEVSIRSPAKKRSTRRIAG